MYNYIPIYMQRRIGSGYYNPIIQYVAEMSGCENRLFLILALCVSGRLIPLAESSGKRVRNQKKIEFRTPRPTACAFSTTPRPTACAFFDRTPADRMAPAQFIAAPQSNL